MKKVFWPIVAFIILSSLMFNAAYYVFGVSAKFAFLIVASSNLFAVIALVLIFRAFFFIDNIVLSFLLFSAAFAFYVSVSAVVVEPSNILANIAFSIIFLSVFITTLFIVVNFVKKEDLPYIRILIAYILEVGIIFFIFLAPLINEAASAIIGIAGIGLAWLVCFIRIPEFLRGSQES